MEKIEHEKALFDFDQDIDELSEIDKKQYKHEKVEVP